MIQEKQRLKEESAEVVKLQMEVQALNALKDQVDQIIETMEYELEAYYQSSLEGNHKGQQAWKLEIQSLKRQQKLELERRQEKEEEAEYLKEQIKAAEKSITLQEEKLRSQRQKGIELKDSMLQIKKEMSGNKTGFVTRNPTELT